MIYHSEIIKKAVRIEDVIESYTGQALKNNRICCPFHSEKTASFFVNRDKQYFKCFGCGIGGDVIKFVELYFNCNFQTAINMLCKDVNIAAEISTVNVARESEEIRKVKAFKKWKDETYRLLHSTLQSAREYQELNRPMIDISEITDDYTYIVGRINLLELYIEMLIADDKEFYKSYRKEVQNIAGRILSRCNSRQDTRIGGRRIVI